MNPEEKISIIVPVYNIEPYIERCVESLVNQTYTNLEIILVDDGSKDGSGEKIDILASNDSRIKVKHKENEGVTKARLDGLKLATGDYIAFADGDDYVELNMYETLLNLAQENDADIAHCGYETVFPNCVDYHNGTGEFLIQDNIQGLKDLLEGKFIEPGLWNKLYKKSLFDNMLSNDLMDTSIKNTEDLLMNFYLFRESKKSVYYDICLYHYMMRPNSATTAKDLHFNRILDSMKVNSIILQEAKDIPEVNEIAKRKYIHGLMKFSSIPIKKHTKVLKPDIKNARKELRKKLPEILKGDYSKQMKAEALWTAIWPASNSYAHRMYFKLKGKDKRYEV